MGQGRRCQALLDRRLKRLELFIILRVQTLLLTNFQSRSIRFRFGEYEGKNNHSSPSCAACGVTSLQRWVKPNKGTKSPT